MVALLLVVLSGGVYVWQRPLLLTGTGYAAHNACALEAVAGRGDPEDDLPPNPLVPVLRTSTQQDRSTSSILGVLATQVAWASGGFGCTLDDHRPDLPTPTAVNPAVNPFTDAPAPTDPPADVREALDHAFGADLSASDRKELGTRAVVVLKELPRNLVFAPLGLSSAVLEPDAVGTPVCSSYMWATPRDWAAVGQFALSDGVWNGQRLLPGGWLVESTKAVGVNSFESAPYASGWWPNQASDGSLVEAGLPADAYFAEGHDGQWTIVVPSQHLVVVRLGFTPTRDDSRGLSTAVLMAHALR